MFSQFGIRMSFECPSDLLIESSGRTSQLNGFEDRFVVIQITLLAKGWHTRSMDILSTDL